MLGRRDSLLSEHAMAVSSQPQQRRVAHIFQESQRSKATHRKLCNSLRTLHENAVAADTEKAFIRELFECINFVLAVKKKEPGVYRIMDFVGTFVQFSREKDLKNRQEEKLRRDNAATSRQQRNANKQNPADDQSDNEDHPPSSLEAEDTSDEIDDSISAKLTEYLIKYLFRGLKTKHKHVRVKACQMLVLIVTNLDDIDDDLFNELKTCLGDRLNDKEASVRSQIVSALSRLQNGEEPGDDNSISKSLGQLLIADPSSEVRKAALLNIVPSKQVLGSVLGRVRDIEPIIRRTMFKVKIPQIIGENFTNLSATIIENLLKCGLRDRDPTVKKACIDMLCDQWIKSSNSRLLELLIKLNVVKSEIVEDMLKAYFLADKKMKWDFNDEFWQNLTPESALIVRCFCDFLALSQSRSSDDVVLMLPSVTKFAYYIQKQCNYIINANADDDNAYSSLVFIVDQLLRLAALLDYADETGRRKMFNLLRDMLCTVDLPEELIPFIVEIIRIISIDERDFVRIVIELVSDIHEGDAEKDAKEGTEEDEEMRLVLRDLKCLYIVKSMLERTIEHLRDMTPMQGIINEVILPSFQKHKHIGMIMELAIACLGLCCMADQQYAIKYSKDFIPFVRLVDHNDDDLKAVVHVALKVLFDLCMIYGVEKLEPTQAQDLNTKQTPVLDCILSGLGSRSQDMGAIAVEGWCKLYMGDMHADPKTLSKLVIMYFDPATATNHRLRQCLSYFLDAFSFSSQRHQQIMAQAFVHTFLQLHHLQQRADKKEMVAMLQIGQQLVDWIDPAKVVADDYAYAPFTSQKEERHALVGIELLKKAFTQDAGTIKAIAQVLCKLDITKTSGLYNIRMLKLLTDKLNAHVLDAVTKNALKKFQTSVTKLDDIRSELPPEILGSLNEFLESIEDESIKSQSSANDDVNNVQPDTPSVESRPRRENEQNGNSDNDFEVSDTLPTRNHDTTSTTTFQTLSVRAIASKRKGAPTPKLEFKQKMQQLLDSDESDQFDSDKDDNSIELASNSDD